VSAYQSRVAIDPQLRGTVPPWLVDWFADMGYRVHRVGQAVYVHGPDLQIIAGCWRRRDTPPPFEARLAAHHRYLIGRGAPTPREHRRLERLGQLFRRLRIRGALGRFVGRPDWWQQLDGSPQPGFLRPWRVA
jgi:hypothetical protein